MMSRSPFSLSSLLILFLRDVTCNPMSYKVIGFSLLLSRIFHHFHIVFAGELRETTSALDIIKEDTIKWSHYWWDERRWRPAIQQGGDV